MAQAEKVATVAEIADRFRSSNAAVITEYRGLTMAQLTELRRSLGRDTAYTVAKNTLVKRAAADAGVAGIDHLFVGPTAVAFVTGEPVDAAKALRDFARTHPLLVIKGGLLDGRALEPGRGHQAGRPGVARGAAEQAGRRDEGHPDEGGHRPERAADEDRAAGRRAAGQAEETEGGAGGADLGVTETVEDAQSDSTAEAPRAPRAPEHRRALRALQSTDRRREHRKR